MARVAAEGISFLTKILPVLGKAFDKALLGNAFLCPRDFSKERGGSRPAFMSANFSHVLTDEGLLLDEPCLYCVRHIRQVCYLAYKIDFPYTSEQTNAVLDGFVRCEEEMPDGDFCIESPFFMKVINNARTVISQVFRNFDPMSIIPRHGPGTTASGIRGEEKWLFTTLYDRLHQKYPYYQYFVVGGASELVDRAKWYRGMTRSLTGKSKVSLVPKDSRGPRLICAEPVEYMWLQQGLGRKIMAHLETNNLTKGVVNFTDQSINQRIALTSSHPGNGEFATLDLKDASDRVGLWLVRYLFRDTTLLPFLEALRSDVTILPDGREISLKKFAPMGSALCFPIESIVFWSLLHALVCTSLKLPLNKSNFRTFVYGDDLIVPTEYAYESIDLLETVGLLVNRDKSCFTGDFRESCGVDAFRGENVTPTKLRRQWQGNTLDATCYAHYVNTVNELHERSYHVAAAALRSRIETVYGPIPTGTEFAGFPCIVVADAVHAEEENFKCSPALKSRYNEDFRNWEFRVRCVVSNQTPTTLDGWTRLARNVLMGAGDDPEQFTLSRSTKLQYRWVFIW